MRRCLALPLLVAGVVSMAACGSDSGGSATSDTTTSGDTSVQPDADGATSGDVTTDVEADAPTVARCVDDTECDTSGGEICSCEGVCVVPTGNACTEDLNCGVPRWCNDCTGHCEEQGDACYSCTLSRGCKGAGECLPYVTGGNFCGKGCLSDTGCDIGFSCVSVPGLDDKQCVADSGSCADLGLCADDGDCPDVEICQAQTRQCAPGCTDDLECVVGKVCVAARCIETCTSTLECTAPAECDDEGKCKIPGACETSAECTQPETYCNKTSGMCVSGCLVDNDCGDAGKECSAQVCVPRGCEHNYQCAFNQECNKATGECFDTQTPHCAACGDSGPDPCNEPAQCVTFQDEDEMPLGDHCLYPCVDDPIDQCPQGYQCQRLDDPNGGDPFFLCARQCFIDPTTIGQ